MKQYKIHFISYIDHRSNVTRKVHLVQLVCFISHYKYILLKLFSRT